MSEKLTHLIKTERHVPSFISDSPIMMAIYKAEDKALYEVLDAINVFYFDSFLDTVKDPLLRRLEAWWKLTVPFGASLEDRRLAVRAKMASKTIYTKRSLYNILASLCGADGFTLDIDVSKYAVNVLVELKSGNQVNTIKRLLHDILPANMVYDVELRYNTHGMLSALTHEEMTEYTHEELRSSMAVREKINGKGVV